ncbi:hypothetical protein btBTE5EL_001334 (plasmid) [Borrelia turicatae]|nr:hypothetical protein btBTE5EL_001334 [Borrelia turicatae]
MYFTNNDINAKNIPILSVIRVPNIQLCSLDVLLNSDAVLSSLLSSSTLLISISFLTRETSFLTLTILLSSSLNLVSILLLRLFSTVSILVSRSLISDLKIVSTL